MFVFFYHDFRQAQSGQEGILGISKSKAKILLKVNKISVSKMSVDGRSQKELEEIVDF